MPFTPVILLQIDLCSSRVNVTHVIDVIMDGSCSDDDREHPNTVWS